MINRDRLVQTFLDLVVIDSPSGQEETVAREIERRLAALGGSVVKDEHFNLIARWPGVGEPLILSAHSDTVGKDVGIKPVVRDGVIYSDGTTILGGDDKSGVAVILEVVESVLESRLPHPPLEVVISVSEELGLQGARWLDKSQLTARRGYVLDADGDTGTIIVSAPSQDSLQFNVHGRKAHAGAEPENGINAIRVASEAIAAMPLGRIDFETTANIGVIEGGVATNIVPDEVHVRGEARSRDNLKLATQTASMVAAFQDAAERHGARVEAKIKRAYSTYRLEESHPVIAHAVAAMKKLGIQPSVHGTGGGTDANIYAEHEIYCAVLSTGQVDVHTTKEHIAIDDMVQSADLLQEIVVTA